MRIATVVSIIALVVASQPAYAQSPASKAKAPSVAEKTLTAEESDTKITAIREKAEALQRARDAKLKRATQSICVGC
ncbi:hypothetical protein [Microvirga calopogonii]|uniref:hypothetical protein n=1 Tax=Microvirga calopogonii TaxID=2078013 RepID=UPI000E0DE4D0|nr:hypothetical protein [Microvirga calopogonii]